MVDRREPDPKLRADLIEGLALREALGDLDPAGRHHDLAGGQQLQEYLLEILAVLEGFQGCPELSNERVELLFAEFADLDLTHMVRE